MANGQSAIGNLLGTTNANGALLVALDGGTIANGTTITEGTGSATAVIGGVLTVNTTATGTGADTNETTLWTYDLPANTLSANNKGVRITVWGTGAANGNTKTIRVKFGGSTVSALAATTSGLDWCATVEVWRTGAATQVSMGRMVFGADTSNGGAVRMDYVTPTETLSGAVTIKMTGQNGTASANDIVFRGAMVEALN